MIMLHWPHSQFFWMPELREREPDKNREGKKHLLMQCGRKMLQGIGVDES
jgi:hypothetical protein